MPKPPILLAGEIVLLLVLVRIRLEALPVIIRARGERANRTSLLLANCLII